MSMIYDIKLLSDQDSPNKYFISNINRINGVDSNNYASNVLLFPLQ